MIILDTNVISEAMRPSPNSNVSQWLSERAPAQLFTTTISLAEILTGVELLPVGKRRSGLLATAETMFSRLFARRVFVFDEAAARAFPAIVVARRSHGRPIAVMDAQIAAIAKVNDAILATRNTADLEDCGIRLANPWRE
ncbi:MAG: type II toxin-antitoxin system VapC family toxin [Terriglobales bacterium]